LPVGDPAVENLALVAEQLLFAKLAERNVQQARLIHVLVAGAEHGDGHAAVPELVAQLTADAVGNDGAGEAAAHNDDILTHEWLFLPVKPVVRLVQRGRFPALRNCLEKGGSRWVLGSLLELIWLS